MSKIIYQPKGAAGEYSKYAANFYVGCLGKNSCKYCYCPGILRGYWPDVPTLKKCFIDEYNAFGIFTKEVSKNFNELQKHGLFFNFVSDPMLPETILLNTTAMRYCITHNIPIKILTKQTWWVDDFIAELKNNNTIWNTIGKQNFISIGFTLTGHDELEPGAATNQERIEAMKKLHDVRFKTWASIEPIIDLESSSLMIGQTRGFCNLYKIGLQSGKKYNKFELVEFYNDISSYLYRDAKIYWKDSFIQQAGIRRDDLPANCVTINFNL